MKRVLSIFIILAVISIALMARERRLAGPSDLAESLVASSALPVSDRISTSAAAVTRNPEAGPVAALDAQDHEKMQILDQILSAKNDNDPRLDRDLRLLSDPLKAAITERYRELPVESRNERGMLVFLVGRNLNRPEDFAFLSEVLKEPRCLSLSNCKAAAPVPGGAPGTPALDETPITDATLAYPQWVALRFLERALGGPLEKQAVTALEAGSKSPNPPIAQRSGELLRRAAGRG